MRISEKESALAKRSRDRQEECDILQKHCHKNRQEGGLCVLA